MRLQRISLVAAGALAAATGCTPPSHPAGPALALRLWGEWDTARSSTRRDSTPVELINLE